MTYGGRGRGRGRGGRGRGGFVISSNAGTLDSRFSQVRRVVSEGGGNRRAMNDGGNRAGIQKSRRGGRGQGSMRGGNAGRQQNSVRGGRGRGGRGRGRGGRGRGGSQQKDRKPLTNEQLDDMLDRYNSRDSRPEKLDRDLDDYWNNPEDEEAADDGDAPAEEGNDEAAEENADEAAPEAATEE